MKNLMEVVGMEVEERLEKLLERGWEAYQNPNTVEAWEEFEEAIKELGFELVESDESDFIVKDKKTGEKYAISGDFSKYFKL